MLDPDRVSKMVEAIRGVTSIPVSVKCRTGVDGCCFFLSFRSRV